MRRLLYPLSIAILLAGSGFSAEIAARVDFSKKLQTWDGFGVNYVQVAQTRDYKKWPQEYGGFSTLSEKQRQEILDLIFGADGLKPGLLKIFLDCYHEGLTRNDRGRFDHRTTTQWLLYFAQEGLKRTRARGGDLDMITTLYGPPGWMTKQQFVRGRDLDPTMKEALGEYLVSWVKFLRQEEKLPVHYVSLHNEGDEMFRWPADGAGAGEERHDFNLYWPSSQVVEFLRMLRPMLDAQGLRDVGPTPGETSSWRNFALTGTPWAIRNDPQALANLGLITSHGFGDVNENLGTPVEFLRLARPGLRAWTTSMSWGKMDVHFLELIRQQIYSVGVNGVIPWSAVQTATWIGGDPNPGTAIRVDGKGGYTVEPGYYFYKQVSRAGQPGTAVAEVESGNQDIRLIAFASNGSPNPDAFVLLNLADRAAQVRTRIAGSLARAFERSVTDSGRRYQALGRIEVNEQSVLCDLPARGVVTFVAIR